MKHNFRHDFVISDSREEVVGQRPAHGHITA